MEEVTMIMSYQGHKEKAVFKVCDLGKTNLIIGIKWLKKHNPTINWKTGEGKMSRCPKECNMCCRKLKKKKREKQEEASPQKYTVTMEEVPDEEMPNGEISINHLINAHQYLFHIIRGGQSWDNNSKKIDKPVEEIVPKKYYEHLSVFSKKESERMPL